MSKKVLYFDVETTGRNWALQDIVQLGFIIEVDGKVVAEHNLNCQPFNWDSIDPEAMEVTGLTMEDLKSYPDPRDMYQEFVEILGKYVDKFDKSDKMYPAGYNVDFDLNFLTSFFKKNDDKYLGSWINWRKLDPLHLLYFHELKGEINLPNYKLSTVCEYFGIEIDAHDAFSDIQATRAVLLKLLYGDLERA